jgi:hypothetical protein
VWKKGEINVNLNCKKIDFFDDIKSTKPVQKEYLKCFLANAQSFVDIEKRSELETYAANMDLDIIAITETWTSKEGNRSMMDSELNMSGYVLYRRDRCEVKTNKGGGGVLIYVKEGLTTMENVELNTLICEAMWIKIYLESGSFLNFGVCYRCNSTTLEETEQMFSAIRNSTKNQAVIVGDFNYPGINWTTLDSKSNEEVFTDLVYDCFLTQHVNLPTRGDNILDLVLTTEPNMVENLQVIEHLSTADHNIIVWDLITSTKMAEQNKENYCFHRAKYEEIKKILASKPWDVLFENKTTDEMWMIFKEILNDTTQEYVPIQKAYKKNRNAYGSIGSKKAIKRRNKRWKKYTTTNDYVDYIKTKRIKL